VLLGRDHPRVVPIGPIVRGVIAFPILGTWWNATTKVASQSVHLQASYGISNTFQQRPSAFWILKILIFNLMTVIVVLTCCCIPNFIKIGSRVRPPDPNDCIMFNAPLLGNGRCHGNRIVHMIGCDHPSCVPVGPLVDELCHLEYFPTWRPSAILNFKNFNI